VKKFELRTAEYEVGMLATTSLCSVFTLST